MTIATNPPSESLPKYRTFACMKCGSPILVYPPDDVHKIASRDRTSFLDVVESIGVCSQCKEVTRLYWGRPVVYRGAIILFRKLRSNVAGGLGQTISRGMRIRGRRGQEEAVEEEASPLSEDEQADIQVRVRDYISENGGAIGLNRAAEDLGIPLEYVKFAIQRMTSEGTLKQAQDAEPPLAQ